MAVPYCPNHPPVAAEAAAAATVRHGEDILDAVSWFRDQHPSLSSIETFVRRVEQIGLTLRASNIVELANARGVDLHSVRADQAGGAS